ISSTARSRKNFMTSKSIGWFVYVVRSAGRLHLSFTSGSSDTLLRAIGTDVACALKATVCVNSSARPFLKALPQRAPEKRPPARAAPIGRPALGDLSVNPPPPRSEEHTSELQS